MAKMFPMTDNIDWFFVLEGHLVDDADHDFRMTINNRDCD